MQAISRENSRGILLPHDLFFGFIDNGRLQFIDGIKQGNQSIPSQHLIRDSMENSSKFQCIYVDIFVDNVGPAA